MAVKSLKEQLADIALKKVKFSNGETLAETMANEARRLYDCIQYYIDEYYRSYTPHVYERTYRLQGALYAEDIADIRIVGNTLHISVAFHRDLDIHPSLNGIEWWDEYDTYHYIDLNPHESSVVRLMNDGWYAHGLERIIGRRVRNLTYFDGIHFIERGIEDYNKTNKLGIKINTDNFYSGKSY